MSRCFRFLVSMLTIAALLPAICPPSISSPRWTPGAPLILSGTIVTPDVVLPHGYVLIQNGRISKVSDRKPDVAGAIFFDTNGLIYPGLVDLHNHVPWNVVPRWAPPRLYSNRYEWRADPEYQSKVGIPFRNLLAGGSFCDMNAYGEMRALVGGTTSILATTAAPCIHGLVRNLDYNSELYGTTELNLEHVVSTIEVPPVTQPQARAQFVGQALFAIASPAYEALLLHLSEGIDATSLEEFNFMQSNGLLNPKGACIHCLALGREQLQAMAANGVSLVWSPRSNVELYAHTVDINAAREAGVRIALAPDWAVTGSSNMLDELHFADRWNRDHLGGALSDRDLVNMVSSTAAAIAGIDDEVGSIRPGLRADLLVISGDDGRPYRDLVEASPADVQLVLVGGIPVYGERASMRSFWDAPDLPEIVVDGRRKALSTPAVPFRFSDVVSRLQAALAAQGLPLAPLSEITE